MGKHCEWLDEQPAFLAEVIAEGEVIATIHALTKMDEASIHRLSGNKIEYDKGVAKFLHIYEDETILNKMLKSLTGHKKAGWVFDRELTVANIALLPKLYFEAIKEAIVKLENQNRVTDGIEKN